MIDNLGYVYYKTGQLPAAHGMLASALAQSPKRSTAWMSLGGVLALEGNAKAAVGAFGVALRHASNAKRSSEALVKLAGSDPNGQVREAAAHALLQYAETRVADSLRPILTKLAGAPVPIYLPSTLSKSSGAAAAARTLYALDNAGFPIEVSTDGYTIALGTEAGCRAQYCLAGYLSATRGKSIEEPTTAERIALPGGLEGVLRLSAEKLSGAILVEKHGVLYEFPYSAAERDLSIRIASLALRAAPMALAALTNPGSTVNTTATSPSAPPRLSGPASGVLSGAAMAPSFPLARPESTGYLPGNPIANDSGLSSFTVDNSRNDGGALVRLYRSGSRVASRTFYVRAADTFSAERLDPGTYMMRYRADDSSDVYEAGPFDLEQSQTSYETTASQVSVTLYKVSHGNLSTRRVAPELF